MKVAIIGGTGAELFPGLSGAISVQPEVRWGSCSAAVECWSWHQHEILFLRRHGPDGAIPPHVVNYRANIQALCDLGADQIVALNAVGGITHQAAPGSLLIPDQLIDYTWGREHTYFDGTDTTLEFIEFTDPYESNLRKNLIDAAARLSLQLAGAGVYGATQGPRLETAAEIARLERDGCDVVGMTGMPEAALARELGVPYASCCFVVNWAAGKGSGAIHAEIDGFLRSGMEAVVSLLSEYLRSSGAAAG